MKTQTKTLKIQTNGKRLIRFFTERLDVDFINEFTNVEIKFDNESEPSYLFDAEIHVKKANQPHTTSFEVPALGEKANINISVNSNYDIEKIMVIATD